MKRYRLFSILFAAMFAAFMALPVAAQTADRADAGSARNARQRIPRRPNLLAELGLSPEQIKQIREINTNRKPQMAEAQRKLREANRALDAAIYADTADRAEIDTRLKDFQTAQAEVARIRFNSELAIRSVLTPEQLGRFRELREKFGDTREEIRERRQERRQQRRNRNAAPGERPDPEF
jgi:Spy/CpxP family protein refolding chaperone